MNKINQKNQNMKKKNKIIKKKAQKNRMKMIR